MKFHLTSKDPRTQAFSHLIFPLASADMADAQLKAIRKLPTAHSAKAIELSKWKLSSYTPLTLALPDPHCPLGIGYWHLFPLNPKLEPLDRWRALGSYLATLPTQGLDTAVLLDAYSQSAALEACKLIWQAAIYHRYSFKRYKSSLKSEVRENSSNQVHFFLGEASSQTKKKELTECKKVILREISHVETINDAISWARDLVNTPAADLTPDVFLKELKKKLPSGSKRISLTVHSKSKLKKIGAGALLGVAQGSNHQPLLLHLKFNPPTKGKSASAKTSKAPRSQKVAIVGKGVTFDSGGLSIKSATGMVDMKSDMAGAAAVAGIFAALNSLPSESLPTCEIHGIIPLAENMVSASSVRPGDVLTSLSGKTIEVVNTDCEGRLILADALTYAQQFEPTTIIDFATLTGACITALGEHFAGLFTNDPMLGKKLENASVASGEPIWGLPLAEEPYRKLLDSPIADIRNSAGTYPGATLAALFLKEFINENTSWAHLDIAGPAYPSSDYLYRQKGATGFGIQLLLEYVAQC